MSVSMIKMMPNDMACLHKYITTGDWCIHIKMVHTGEKISVS